MEKRDVRQEWCSFYFFKQKTGYMISECDWSSVVCSSDRRGGRGSLMEGPYLGISRGIRSSGAHTTL